MKTTEIANAAAVPLKVPRAIDNSGIRQTTNRRNAIALAMAGLYVFPSSGKTPLIPRFNRRDDQLTADERETAIEEYKLKHRDREGNGIPPCHVGATRDKEVVKKMWRAHPDAVPSIACGPSELVILDADAKDDGPLKMRALFEANGGVPAGVPINPTKSGGEHFAFRDRDGKFTNKAGLLKSEYGTDVRGVNGQIVAPGSIREDGATYGTEEDLAKFLRALTDRKVPTPELPDFIVELIGEQPEGPGETAKESDYLPIIKRLEEVDWPEYNDIFAPVAIDGLYDLDLLRRNDEKFADLYDNPESDVSTARWNIACKLLYYWPQMPVEHLAVFYEKWDGAGSQTEDGKGTGNYRLRDIAREWYKNKLALEAKGHTESPSNPSDGAAFEPVEDSPEDVEQEMKLIEERDAAEQAAAKRGMLYRGCDLVARYKSPDWLVQNLLAPRTVGAISGASNVGKSFGVLDLCQHLARGRKWFGLNVERCGVLYAYGEGHLGIASRLLAWEKRNDAAGGDIIVRDGIPNFASDTNAAITALKRAVREANKMVEETGTPPIKVVVLDTFAKATAGAEENSARDMGPIMAALRRLADDLNMCVVIVHHTGKNSALGLRGSTAILGDVDFNIEVIDSEAGKRKKPVVSVPAGQLCMYVAKMRDAAKGAKLFFKLEPVVVGCDKWGSEETSMVVRPITQDTAADNLEAVEDEDSPSSTDKLCPELQRAAHERAEKARMKTLYEVVQAVRTHGKKTQNGTYVKLQSLANVVPALQDLKSQVGASNFVRRFKERFLLSDSEVDLEEGSLRLRDSRKRGCSAELVFIPVSPAVAKAA